MGWADGGQSKRVVIPETPASAPAPVSAEDAARLAWYRGDTDRQPAAAVLAPRGFHCTSRLYPDDSFKLRVFPGKRPEFRVVSVVGESTAGAELVCNLLPALRPLSYSPDRCRTPPGALVVRHGVHLVGAVAPSTAGRVRLVDGTAVRSAHPDRAFVYWYPQLSRLAQGADCVLASARLCAAVLREARARLGATLTSLLAAQRHVPARPLELRRLRSGEACPVSPLVDTQTAELRTAGRAGLYTTGGVIDLSLSVADANGWLGAKAAWAIEGYRGPIRIRGRRLDGSSPVRFWNNYGDHTREARWADDDRPANRIGDTYFLPAAVYVRHTGCYGFQVDGTSFSAQVVVRVVRR